MKERPILFSGPMVRAILAGRKSQTRRIVKPQPLDIVPIGGTFASAWNEKTAEAYEHFHCPCGQPGDRLWVRETSRAVELPSGLDGVEYIADGHFEKIKNTESASELWSVMHNYRGGSGLPVPPIHMPRWASRITLEITAVRVERLQDISEDDAKAEGIERVSRLGILRCAGWRDYSGETTGFMSPLKSYASLWQSINGPDSWEKNPWVWVIEFRKI